jgi:Ion channel
VSFFDSSEGVLFGLFNLALFYLAAVIAFSFLWEKWTIIDSVYFATVTFTSVGEFGLVKFRNFDLFSF